MIRQENKGLAAARNAAIAASNGEYILLLDADNRLRPAYIDHGIRILDNEPRVGVVYGDAEYIGTRSGRWRVGPFERGRLIESNYIDACAIIRRSVWIENGGYDGFMPIQGAEDWDFWLSTLEHGWQFAYVPEVLFDYRVAEESMITRLRASRASQEPLEKFLASKHGLLYRRAFVALATERRSPRLVSRHLVSLLVSRLNGRPRS